jgi:membrane protein insertase Oxa1/YidC/SpoIIIJ
MHLHKEVHSGIRQKNRLTKEFFLLIQPFYLLWLPVIAKIVSYFNRKNEKHKKDEKMERIFLSYPLVAFHKGAIFVV